MSDRRDDGRRVNVLFVMGSGRDGSTILANAIGENAGFASFGELAYFWERGVLGGWPCGCGRPLESCGFWQGVTKRLGPESIVPVARRMTAFLTRNLRVLPMLTLRLPRRLRAAAKRADDELEEVMFHIGRLYAAIGESSGAQFIVDSSKNPVYAALLRSIPGIDVWTIHLIRDSRAVAFSWSTSKRDRSGVRESMPRRGPLRSAVGWLTYHAIAETLWRGRRSHYLRLTYDEFVRDPYDAISRIIELVSGDGSRSPESLDGNIVDLHVHHTVSGNPTRFLTGEVVLRSDERWRRDMPRTQRWVTTLLTWPGLWRYRLGFARRGDRR